MLNKGGMDKREIMVRLIVAGITSDKVIPGGYVKWADEIADGILKRSRETRRRGPKPKRPSPWPEI